MFLARRRSAVRLDVVSLINLFTRKTNVDSLLLGRRLRHFRKHAGLTLDQLGSAVGKPAPYLSQVENGKREPRLSTIGALADALGVTVAELLREEAPDHRSALEIAWTRAQEDPLLSRLGLPTVRASRSMSDQTLEALVGLYEALKRQTAARAATPEEARQANARLRRRARQRNNYFGEIEKMAGEAIDVINYDGVGALSQRNLLDLAKHFGFEIRLVQDMPSAVRSVADQRHGRIYIPQRDELRTRRARSVILQTIGHHALGHHEPDTFGEFLQQRVESSYFAAAVLVPERAAVPFLRAARDARDISVEDIKERYYVSYEMAAHRFTNLATEHLGLRVHMIRSDADGVIWKAYENNGVPFPHDMDGAIEGQRLCREWGTRKAFQSDQKFSIHYQYTDTAAGTYWCSTHVEADRSPHHAVTVGAGFDDAQYFRGRDTELRTVSGCPDGECCRVASAELTAKWDGYVWPSTKAHSHVLAALPAGSFPGVDITEVYEFLDRHS